MANRDPEATKARILAAAVREFSAKGISGARVDAIAARARVNKRMLYYYFESKEGLFRIPDDLDAAQLVLSEVCLTMGPFLLPQLAHLVTGKSVKDPEFLAQREEFLRALGRRLTT